MLLLNNTQITQLLQLYMHRLPIYISFIQKIYFPIPSIYHPLSCLLFYLYLYIYYRFIIYRYQILDNVVKLSY